MNKSRFDQFIHCYPAYLSTTALDELRASDYSRLDRNHENYLDYTGGSLYAESQVRRHQELLINGVFGNPHSTNPTSHAATELIEATRQSILRFFNADAGKYVVIFTSNASGALKLVGEAYPFGEGCRYLLTFDNHNSVNGIREYAVSKGASVTYVPVLPPRMRLDEKKLESLLTQRKEGCNNLFAFPAQSNFSAVQHSLSWVEKAHELGWDVLLDVAAFVPTNRLDLSLWKPDFVPVSFYKMFGYPTGIGALIARREVIKKLKRPWFAGGTITVASVQPERHYLAEVPAAFEDGTLDYLNIPAVQIGLSHLESIGMDIIHERVHCLTGWLLDNLLEIKYPNGKPLVKIYGPVTMEKRGGAIAMNFVDPEGNVIDHRSIEENANRREISLRTGCFCNPGAGELALGISSSELNSCFARPDHEQRLTYDEFRLCIDGKASGAVRISVGLVSNFADVEAFLEFTRRMVSGKGMVS
jgi:selenocysteine lyase/cysteine desulfurase